MGSISRWRAAPEPTVCGLPERWFYLGLGLLLAPVFTFTPILRYMGWFLASLVHELGHTVVAWVFGCPAFPAIRLDGHAAAVHSDQMPLLCGVVMVSLVVLAWRSRGRKALLFLFGGAALLYPLFAFTRAKEFLFLFGGQGGELAFATIFFYRALTGGFSDSGAERCAYSCTAFYLLGRNLHLSLGLMTSESVRAWYRTSGSFSLENDLLRIAHDVLHWSVPNTASLLLLASLAVLPAAFLLVRCRRCPASSATTISAAWPAGSARPVSTAPGRPQSRAPASSSAAAARSASSSRWTGR